MSGSAGDTIFRISDGNQLIAEVPRTATKPITRFKVRKPEPPRPPASNTGVVPT